MAYEMSPMEVDQENQLAIVIVDQPTKAEEPRFYEGTFFGLPREWTVELRPRKVYSKYRGKVDQFFYEPGTRKQFRSFKAVKKYLDIDGGGSSHKRKLKTSKGTDQSKKRDEKETFESKAAGLSENLDKKNKDGSNGKVAEEDKEEENHHYFDMIAKRVKWQLTNGEQNNWDMYVKVPDSVQERWLDMFLKPDMYD